MLYFTHLPRSPQWMDLYLIWYKESPRGRNQLCRILCPLVQGHWFCRGLKYAYPHRNWRSPLTLSELPFRLWWLLTLKSDGRTLFSWHHCAVTTVKLWYIRRFDHGVGNHKQVALLSQRGRAMLRVGQYLALIVQYLVRSFFLLLVTSASDLPVRTIRFCSVVFSVTSSLAIIHTIRGRPWLCSVRDRAWSVLHWVIACGAYKWSNTRIPALNKNPTTGAIYNHGAAVIDRKVIVENRDFSIPYLHSTPPLRGFPSKYCHAVWYGKL